MKLLCKQGWIIAVFLTISITLASCNLPTGNTPAAGNSLPEPSATTPPAALGETQATETPNAAASESADTLSLDDIIPVSGARLKWIDYSEFVYVPAGEFIMGQDSTIPSDHAPAHTVSLGGFWIQQTEVTNLQYAACVAAGVCSAPAQEEDTPYWYTQPDQSNAPVVGVTWIQASQYCEYIESRLPTEAEWELAARGTENRTYPWGEDAPTCALLNYNDCLDPSEPEDTRSYLEGASQYEAADMSGNVSEWVNDWYDDEYYATSPASNPVGALDGTKKVYRGGSYLSGPQDVVPITRSAIKPEEHAADLGFRCVLNGDLDPNGLFGAQGGYQVPRQCEVPPVAEQPEIAATWTPVPCQPVVTTGHCDIHNGLRYISITLYQANCQYNLLSGFGSNAVPDLNCVASSNSLTTDPKSYDCTGTNMAQGMSVDIFVWHDYAFSQPVLNCPAGYEMDQSNMFCKPIGTWLPEPPCPWGYSQLFDWCFPDFDEQSGCPVGFYEINVSLGPGPWQSFCEPLEQCLLDDNPDACSVPVCPSGQTYDPSNNCCAAPHTLELTCPIGYSLLNDPVFNKQYCDHRWHELDYEDLLVKVPYCATWTPSPTPTSTPKPPDQVNCSDYDNMPDACAAHDCEYTTDPSGYGNCENN